MAEQTFTAKQVAAAVGASLAMAGGGGFVAIEELDVLGVDAAARERASMQRQIERLRDDKDALLGQNCELLRAIGAIREDANCWGTER